MQISSDKPKLGCNINPSSFALNFAGFIQPKNYIANFFFIKTGFGLYFRKTQALFGVFDGIQNNINCCQGCSTAGLAGSGIVDA